MSIVSTVMLLSCFLIAHLAFCQTIPREARINEVVKAALVLDSVPVFDLNESNFPLLDDFTRTTWYSNFFSDEKARKRNGLKESDKAYLDKQHIDSSKINIDVLEDVTFITQDSVKQLAARIDRENDSRELGAKMGFIYYTISKPLFTTDGRKAFITIHQVCHYLLCGESWTLLLGEERGQWKILDKKRSILKI